jgi:hypothetical protein
MNEFIILLRPYPLVQDSLILNSRDAGMLNNLSEFRPLVMVLSVN